MPPQEAIEKLTTHIQGLRGRLRHLQGVDEQRKTMEEKAKQMEMKVNETSKFMVRLGFAGGGGGWWFASLSGWT